MRVQTAVFAALCWASYVQAFVPASSLSLSSPNARFVPLRKVRKHACTRNGFFFGSWQTHPPCRRMKESVDQDSKFLCVRQFYQILHMQAQPNERCGRRGMLLKGAVAVCTAPDYLCLLLCCCNMWRARWDMTAL